MDKANRLYNRIEPFSARFLALGDVLAHIRHTCTDTGDPACIPQLWYWHGTVRQGSVMFNLSEEATPSSPLDVHTLCRSVTNIYSWV